MVAKSLLVQLNGLIPQASATIGRVMYASSGIITLPLYFGFQRLRQVVRSAAGTWVLSKIMRLGAPVVGNRPELTVDPVELVERQRGVDALERRDLARDQPARSGLRSCSAVIEPESTRKRSQGTVPARALANSSSTEPARTTLNLSPSVLARLLEPGIVVVRLPRQHVDAAGRRRRASYAGPQSGDGEDKASRRGPLKQISAREAARSGVVAMLLHVPSF